MNPGVETMILLPYLRDEAVRYARQWALSRNPAYYDFERIGGDCTNFASQCVLAGARVMNLTPVMGWYYRTLADRTASWSGVEYLYSFLVNNQAEGPYGREVPVEEAQPGDLVQLGGRDGRFYHCPVITAVSPGIIVAAHSFDALDRPLSSYAFDAVRFIHLDGARM